MIGFKTVSFLAFIVYFCAFAMAVDYSETVIKTVDNRPVKARIYMPAEKTISPAVIIAPGQGYHQGLPIIEGLAGMLARNGMIAVSFDWYFFSPKNLL